MDHLSFLHRGVFSGRDQRSGGKDGKGVDHAPSNILVGGGGRFLCLNGYFGVLHDFANSVAPGDGEGFLGGFCGGVVCRRFGHARALVLRSYGSGAGLRKSGAISGTQKSACRQHSLALEIQSAEREGGYSSRSGSVLGAAWSSLPSVFKSGGEYSEFAVGTGTVRLDSVTRRLFVRGLVAALCGFHADAGSASGHVCGGVSPWILYEVCAGEAAGEVWHSG